MTLHAVPAYEPTALHDLFADALRTARVEALLVHVDRVIAETPGGEYSAAMADMVAARDMVRESA